MSRIEALAEGVTLYLGDCREILPTLGKVDAVISSPPYDAIRDYGEAASMPVDCIPSIAASVGAGGVVMWNVADQVIDGSETGTSFRHALKFMGCGLRLHDTMIYCKDGVPFPDNDRYMQAHEYMFVFSNGAPKTFNGIRDRPNKYAGTINHGTRRRADGVLRQVGNGHVTPDIGLRFNWWVMSNRGHRDLGHPAPMPVEMASCHIQTWTNQGDIVSDPFMGSGTTGIEAIRLGRKFIGVEIDRGYFDISCRRLEKALASPDMFAAG